MEAIAPMSIVQSTTYAIQRSTIGFSRMISSPGFFRVIKLMMTKTISKKNVTAIFFKPNPELVSAKTSLKCILHSVIGLSGFRSTNSDGMFVIFLIMRTASPALPALKKIHAKVTRQNVMMILTATGTRNFSCNGLVARPAHWYDKVQGMAHKRHKQILYKSEI